MEFPLTAYLGLLAIIPFTFYAFSTQKSAVRATLMVAFGAALFMPEHAKIKLPGIPPIDKSTLPYICLFWAVLFKASARVQQAKWMRGVDLLILVTFLAGFGTAITNSDPVVAGGWRKVYIPGLRITDGLALGLGDIMRIGLPFLVGRAMFRTRDDMYTMMKFLVSTGIVYSVFCWIEMRFSPQTHAWVYGYSPHNDFLQTIRWGGYRPMVFMYHGLAVAAIMFAMTSFAWVLVGAGFKKLWRWSAKRVAVYLTVVLILCKSTGAIAYIAIAGLLLRSTPKARVRFAVVLAAIAVGYPSLRANNLVPVNGLLDWSNSTFGPERTESMEFRLRNEEAVLEHSAPRGLFGWGEFGRNTLYRDDGRELSVLDGYWIIRYSTRGAFGFYPAFLLLTLPIFVGARKLKLVPGERDKHAFSGFILTYSILVFDLLPNALFSNYTYLMAGALYGLTQGMTTPAAIAAARRGASAGRTRKAAPQPANVQQPAMASRTTHQLAEYIAAEVQQSEAYRAASAPGDSASSDSYQNESPPADYPAGYDYRGATRRPADAPKQYPTMVGYPAQPSPPSSDSGAADEHNDPERRT